MCPTEENIVLVRSIFTLHSASRDRPYRTRRRPWTVRGLVSLPPDLHVNGWQVMGTGTLTTVINYLHHKRCWNWLSSTRTHWIYLRNKFWFTRKSACSLIACISLVMSSVWALFNINNNEQFIIRKHTILLNMRTTFLPIRQIQLDWLDSGSLNANLADGPPTLAQSKADH